jgi:uncharacterized membrane protein YdjX (TVP38/TMEM64 family)
MRIQRRRQNSIQLNASKIMLPPPSQNSSSDDSVDKDNTSVPFEDAELASVIVPVNAESSGASVNDVAVNDAGNDAGNDEDTEPNKVIGWFLSPKVLIGLLLLGIIVFVIVDTATTGYVREGVESFLNWMKDNPIAGFFLFVIGKNAKRRNGSQTGGGFKAAISDSFFVQCSAVYIVAKIFFIPGSILNLGAGVVFSTTFGIATGVVVGTIAVFLGASLGAVASFLLARYLLREQVSQLCTKYAIFQALDLALQQNGLKILVLLRLSPVIPFNAINYMAGVTAVSFRNFVLALFAILPGISMLVFLGASAGSLADSASKGQDPTVIIIVVVVGSVSGILAICLISRYARNALNDVMEQRRAEADSAQEDDVEEPAVNENFTGAVEDSLAVDDSNHTIAERATSGESAVPTGDVL